MADNIELDAGSGGAVIATDEAAGGEHFQYVKLAFGPDNTQTLVTASVGLPVGDAGGSLTVDGEVTANLSATDNAVLDSIDAAVNGTLVVDATGQGDVPVTLDGETVAVDLGANNDVTATGNVAHDAADSGSPLKIGAKAVNTEQAAVAAADRVDLVADLVGKLVVSPHAVKEDFVQGTASATDTSDTSVIAAQGAGVRIYVTTLVIANTSATDTDVAIKDGTTEIMRVPAPANGGATLNLAVPLALTANAALQFASSDSVSTMYVTAVGYKGS
jgi:hypothetical protein